MTAERSKQTEILRPIGPVSLQLLNKGGVKPWQRWAAAVQPELEALVAASGIENPKDVEKVLQGAWYQFPHTLKERPRKDCDVTWVIKRVLEQQIAEVHGKDPQPVFAPLSQKSPNVPSTASKVRPGLPDTQKKTFRHNPDVLQRLETNLAVILRMEEAGATPELIAAAVGKTVAGLSELKRKANVAYNQAILKS